MAGRTDHWCTTCFFGGSITYPNSFLPLIMHVNEETPLLPVVKPTPLPWKQFSIILLTQLVEPLTSQVLLPFAPQVRTPGRTFLIKIIPSHLARSRYRHHEWGRNEGWALRWNAGECQKISVVWRETLQSVLVVDFFPS